MARFIQLHALTIYAPSNLNRDDTGRPKTARFGGVERLRISSQALKRAIRTSDGFKDRLTQHRGTRTQRLGETIQQHLVAKGQTPDAALEIARKIAEVFGKLKDPKDANPTHIEQLAFISPEEQAQAIALADQAASGKKLPDKKDELVETLLRKADTAVDIAMFGRMLADNPEYNREAAVQIAHAITTHKVDVEDDFYTAVDDLKKSAEDAGAGFIGELGFGSGVFYTYACIDKALLASNLDGNAALADDAIAALIEGLATASPGGKQASFASRARASYLRAEKGGQQPRSLAAAFFKPVRGEDLLSLSIKAIGDTAAAMDKAYGKCADATTEMNVAAGTGTLQDIIAFARS
jgi:CRISPR system Cascade subunit CasC